VDAVDVVAGIVVSNANRVELLATAVKASPAALAVPNVKAGVVRVVNRGIGVTEIPIPLNPIQTGFIVHREKLRGGTRDGLAYQYPTGRGIGWGARKPAHIFA